jgi:AhpD family alkylhydroperoxidase
MAQRINFTKVSPAAVRAMLGLEKAVNQSGLEHSLQNLIKLRASQINGCAYCIDMHFKDAKAEGETDERLYMLNAWHEATCYTDRERAALLWTDAVTRIADNHVPDDVFESVRHEFDEQELVALTLAIVTINGWNRFAISFAAEPGKYQPAEPQLA